MTKSTQPRNLGTSEEPRYAIEEPQPKSAISERAALTEREDGTISEGSPQQGVPNRASDEALPIIKLTGDERQPIEAVAEYHASSEREDGTNTG